ncbi:hypothetical protein PTKU46_78390 [Paraburkholderia terrae]
MTGVPGGIRLEADPTHKWPDSLFRKPVRGIGRQQINPRNDSCWQSFVCHCMQPLCLSKRLRSGTFGLYMNARDNWGSYGGAPECSDIKVAAQRFVRSEHEVVGIVCFLKPWIPQARRGEPPQVVVCVNDRIWQP